MNLSVSVIIPAYNAVNFLERAVKSALIQDFVKEIIIVEDGSQDYTYDLALKLEEEYDIVQVQTHENRVNKGLAATRNRGLEFATGDWIQFLDADDELLAGKIQSQLMNVSNLSSFVVGNAIDVFPNGRINKRKYKKNSWSALISSKLGISSANLFNRMTIIQIGGFDERLRTSEEYDLMFRLMKNGYKPVFDPSYLVKIYFTEGSLSRGDKYANIFYKNWIHLRRQIREYLIGESNFNLYTKYIYSGVVGTFQEKYFKPFDDTVNLKLLNIYKVEKKMKIKIVSLFKNLC